MKRILLLIQTVFLISFSQTSYSDDFSLFIKPCKSCEWIYYPSAFRLKEQCEIARQGIFIKGMTKCLKTI